MEVSDADRVVAMCIVLEHSVITFGGVEQAKLGVDAAQTLSTQSAELYALRGEVERFHRAHEMSFNQAMSNGQAFQDAQTTIAQLRARVAGLEEGLRDFDQLMRQREYELGALSDEMMVIVTKARALLTQNEVG